jgi:hypothetical protein
MAKLTGPAADARLARAWETVLDHDPAGQQIIHVLTRPTDYPAWLAGFPPFEAWTRDGGRATDEVWRVFAETAAPWPYIRDARRAAVTGIPNVRIVVLERAQWEAAPPWLRFVAQVHLPAIAALASERLYQLWLEDCRDAGLPDRDYDVNLWGAAGVMLTGYADGDVAWRAFLADDPDPDRTRQERDFVMAARQLAVTHGQLISLPAMRLR